MTYVKTERLPNEAIIINTYADHISPEDILRSVPMVTTYLQNIIKEIGPYLYQIIDARQSTMTFKEALDVLRMPKPNENPLAPPFFQMNMVMVGTGAMAKFYVQASQQQQFRQQQIPLFADMDAAIAAARTAIALHYASGAKPLP